MLSPSTDTEVLSYCQKQGYIGVGLGSAIIPAEFVKNREWHKASEHIGDMLAGLKG